MRYQRAYLYFFSSPFWPSNLLGGSLCILVPVAGWIMAWGYGTELASWASREDDGKYPTLDINRLAEYLQRGSAPFFVHLLLLAPILLLLGLSGGLISYVITKGPRPEDRAVLIYLATGAAITFGLIVLFLLLSLLAVPLVLYAGLRQEWAMGPAFAFVPEFLRKVGKELILAQVFLLATGSCLMAIGLAAAFLGFFPAAAVVVCAQHHFLGQLYRLYLTRGGMAVPGPATQTDGSTET